MRPRLVLLICALAPLALAQTTAAADRVVPVTPASPDAVDTLLEMVGPVPATEKPHVERFGEFVLDTVGPVPLVGEAAGAGIGQWMNSPPEWGQGWAAFGKRYASNLAYNAVRQTVSYAGSMALREDTRYFASSRRGFWPRTKHALVSTFTARTMDGHDRFSVSNTASVVAAAGVSSIWGPDSWKGPGNIAIEAGLSFASTAAFNVVREFLPDIFRRNPQK
jgi:hypothetical protein